MQRGVLLLARAPPRLRCAHQLTAVRFHTAQHRPFHLVGKRVASNGGYRSCRGARASSSTTQEGGSNASSVQTDPQRANGARGADHAPQRVLVVGKVWPERTSTAAGVRTADLVRLPCQSRRSEPHGAHRRISHHTPSGEDLPTRTAARNGGRGRGSRMRRTTESHEHLTMRASIPRLIIVGPPHPGWRVPTCRGGGELHLRGAAERA
jgi:hypothetical protein